MASDALMTVDEVADRLRVSRWTIYRWRTLGEGPRSFKVGGAVRYRLSDVLAYEEHQLDEATAGR